MVIKTLDSELDPDPQLGKMLDPDPHSFNADPQPCLEGFPLLLGAEQPEQDMRRQVQMVPENGTYLTVKIL